MFVREKVLQLVKTHEKHIIIMGLVCSTASYLSGVGQNLTYQDLRDRVESGCIVHKEITNVGILSLKGASVV